MPKPKKSESKNKYISRTIKEFRSEGYSQNQAVGRAEGFWKTYHKSTKKPKRK